MAFFSGDHADPARSSASGRSRMMVFRPPRCPHAALGLQVAIEDNVRGTSGRCHPRPFRDCRSLGDLSMVSELEGQCCPR